mmetsp:Transcript_85/g.156  ORF Transcript_85/g.156 Transcript_85/m.156 type:complete len:107 (+) Transcript_85:298-618(+)
MRDPITTRLGSVVESSRYARGQVCNQKGAMQQRNNSNQNHAWLLSLYQVDVECKLVRLEDHGCTGLTQHAAKFAEHQNHLCPSLHDRYPAIPRYKSRNWFPIGRFA